MIFCSVQAQVNFTAKASAREIGKADYVQIEFAIENAKQIENLQTPEFPDFNIVQGPSQSTGMTVVNGAMSQSQGIIYVLQPKRTGLLTIRSATATIDGKLMHSNGLQIEVRNQSPSGPNNAAQPGFSPLPDPNWPAAQPEVDMDEVIRPGENVQEKIKKNFFVRVEVSKTDCYVGEPIVATYKLYARLRSDSRVTKHPSLNGFSVYDMVDPADDRVSVEKINGKNFSVHIIRKTQLIPLQPGDVTLDPVEIDNNIYFIKSDAGGVKKSRQGFGGLLDRLFQPEPSGTAFTQHIVLESKPLTIHIKPLPEDGKPADFNGAVGKYTILASMNSKEVDTGDAAILSVTVRGSGNLPVVNAPLISWPANMEAYDVNSKENIDKATAPLGGTKTYNYSFISTKVGKYDLPPVRLSYFDPASKMYKTVETDPVHIDVIASKKVRPNKQETPEKMVERNWSVYALWAAAFLLLAGATIFIIRESKKDAELKIKKAKAAEAVEKMKAMPSPVDPLLETSELMAAGDFGKFYASLNRAIWKSVSDKLQLPSSELNKLNIASGLRTKGWSDEEIIQLKNVLNECEIKLYTPEYSSIDMQRLFASAQRIVNRLQP